jgi:hypothetical protein
VMRLDAEPAARILGRHDPHVIRIDDNGERSGNAQSHADAPCLAAAASFARASSSVPTI